MKNKLIIIISFIIILALLGFIVFKLRNNKDYEGSFYDGDNQTEVEGPVYDVGQYIPEDNTIQKDITITITNLDDFDIPEQVSLENELNYLINDLITYCFQLKEKGLDKDDTYGYKSRRVLIDKLKEIEEKEFPHWDCVG